MHMCVSCTVYPYVCRGVCKCVGVYVLYVCGNVCTHVCGDVRGEIKNKRDSFNKKTTIRDSKVFIS
jgi:hypothetical protein